MSNFIRRDKSFVRLLALLILIYGIHRGESHLSELLFEEEESPALLAASNSNHLPPMAHADILQPREDITTCQVEFTVLKRAVGRCIKVGKARACLSGSYLHPFHPDCM